MSSARTSSCPALIALPSSGAKAALAPTPAASDVSPVRTHAAYVRSAAKIVRSAANTVLRSALFSTSLTAAATFSVFFRTGSGKGVCLAVRFAELKAGPRRGQLVWDAPRSGG